MKQPNMQKGLSMKCGECCCDKICICQSCAMPITKEELYGTNADSSKNEEYCIYCYQKGKFTEPNLTIEMMVEKAAPFLAKEQNIGLEKAKELLTEAIKSLKRWKK